MRPSISDTECTDKEDKKTATYILSNFLKPLNNLLVLFNFPNRQTDASVNLAINRYDNIFNITKRMRR